MYPLMGTRRTWRISSDVIGQGIHASSVLFATVGIVESEARRNSETTLIRAVAGEIHRIARELLGKEVSLEEAEEHLRRGVKRFGGPGVAHEEEEMEAEMGRASRDGMVMNRRGARQTGDSHRRRHTLAAHHKDFVSEHPRPLPGEEEDDTEFLQTVSMQETFFMAMWRTISEVGGEDDEPGAATPDVHTRCTSGRRGRRRAQESGYGPT